MLISETYPQFGLRAAICPHEVEIASNRGSAGRGEYVLGSCTHRQSTIFVLKTRVAAYLANWLKSNLCILQSSQKNLAVPAE